jgi:hypothetical protein
MLRFVSANHHVDVLRFHGATHTSTMSRPNVSKQSKLSSKRTGSGSVAQSRLDSFFGERSTVRPISCHLYFIFVNPCLHLMLIQNSTSFNDLIFSSVAQWLTLLQNSFVAISSLAIAFQKVYNPNNSHRALPLLSWYAMIVASIRGSANDSPLNVPLPAGL